MRTLMAFVVMLSCLRLNAQVQELQQLKLDIEKLAQFKIILSQMKQGYQVLQNGYNSVRDAARGNFDLHKNYLDGLLAVNPSVKQSPALKQVAAKQLSAAQLFQNAMQQYQASGQFSAAELMALRNQYNECVQRMNDGTDLLAQVLAPGALRMDDAERLQIIATVQAEVSAECSAIKTMVADHSRLMGLRTQQRKDNGSFRKLSGLK